MEYRRATPADEPFLREMLWLAYNWRDQSVAADHWPDPDGPPAPVCRGLRPPGYRGRGVAGELLERLKARAAANGLRGISLSVEPDNHALRIYERAGFEPAGGSGGSVTLMATL